MTSRVLSDLSVILMITLQKTTFGSSEPDGYRGCMQGSSRKKKILDDYVFKIPRLILQKDILGQ